MKKLSILLAGVFLISACSNGEPTQTEPVTTQSITVTSTATDAPPTPTLPEPTATATRTPTPSPTPLYPDEGFGPDNFPNDVNPLTGLYVTNEHFLKEVLNREDLYNNDKSEETKITTPRRKVVQRSVEKAY